MRIEEQQPWINNYWLDGVHIGQDDYYHVPVQIGEGLFIRALEGKRFRVVDIWYSDDKHGAFDIGRHVFVEEVTGTPGDVLRNTVPDYFASGA